MVYRIFVEKKPALAYEAKTLAHDIKYLLGIDGVTGVRILNRYDVEGLDRETFDYAVKTILSEPQLDTVSDTVAGD